MAKEKRSNVQVSVCLFLRVAVLFKEDVDPPLPSAIDFFSRDILLPQTTLTNTIMPGCVSVAIKHE